MSTCSLLVAVWSLNRVYFLQLLHYLVVLDHGFGWFSKDNGLLWWLSGRVCLPMQETHEMQDQSLG